ncbi:putative apyrase 6 isoform X2 [Iris pallida]|uniref:Apyrase 6 isoform X2 n=1 Tax=Iris pallida TaxID=29817 RepID=A0AAX6HQF4_IRIPA|nr:putative apyrase 6 isoform X2 [Iris pallida]
MLQAEKDKCQYQQCHLGSNFIPKLQGRFLATENFFYTSKFFKLGPTPILSDFMLVGKYFCGEDFLTLKEKYQTLEAEDFSRYCFSSAYIVALLHDSFGIALDDNRLQYANQVGSTELEWALGAFIMHNMSNLNTNHAYEITALVRCNIASILSLFVVIVLLAFAVWIVLRWRKPQLKTIYDLEKGRYIITRVNR